MASKYHSGRLRGSRFDDEEILNGAVEHFDLNTKRQFGPESEKGLVKVGERRTNDARLGIRGGFLTLTRSVREVNVQTIY